MGPLPACLPEWSCFPAALHQLQESHPFPVALLVLVGLLWMETECAALESLIRPLQGAQGSCAVLLNQHAALKHWESWHPVKVSLELWCAHMVPRRSVLIRSNHLVNVWKCSIDGNVSTRAGWRLGILVRQKELFFFLPSPSEFQEIGARPLTSRLLSPRKDFPNPSLWFPSLQYPQPRDVWDAEEAPQSLHWI